MMKRSLDILIILLAAPVWIPLLLCTLFAVWLCMGRPVFFMQKRAGRAGKPFTLFKFRTMLEQRDASGILLPDDRRLTRFGGWLRSTSLDELPELINVLKGDMTLVGPRPLPVAYTERYSARQRGRLAVRPGITGWAQVNGRNAVEWDRRFELDLWYIRHQSLLLDLRILCRTLGAVLGKEGIAAEGSATMKEFMGSDPDAGQKQNPPPPDCPDPFQRSGS